MMFVHVMTSFGRSVVILVAIGTAFAAGCAGKSTGDDDEDGDNGGSSSVGGTAGAFGGTSSGFGGTSPGQSSCVSVCQRAQMCPGSEPADCASVCRDAENEAAATGCTAEFRNLAACLDEASDVCSADSTECQIEAEVYVNCILNGGTGNCTSGVVTSADCTAVCQRAQACPEATPTDCATSCSQELASMAEIGCTPEYQAALGCFSTCTNICAVSSTDCAFELDALSSCAAI
jgi:hypothetical protein